MSEPLNKGDVVYVVCDPRMSPRKFTNKIGVILVVDRDNYGVKFNENVGGHDLNGRCENGHGWNFSLNELVKMRPIAEIIKEDTAKA